MVCGNTLQMIVESFFFSDKLVFVLLGQNSVKILNFVL